MSGLTALDYKRAIDSQSACNLSGLVHSLAEVMPRITEVTNGTEERNNHPIVRLYVAQMAYLSGGTDNHEDYARAFSFCNEQSFKENLQDAMREAIDANPERHPASDKEV